MIKKNNSVQEWLLIEKIFENGILKLKNGNYIKIIKVIPINFNLKSELEKQAILNSYKVFLKTCNFDLQILIQSNKEDLSKHISSVNYFTNKESKKIKEISEQYIEFLNEINSQKKSATKNFYIVIKKCKKNYNNKNEELIKDVEGLIFEELNEQYLKIKDAIMRCGNIVTEINEKNTIKKILFSFFYPKNIKSGGDVN